MAYLHIILCYIPKFTIFMYGGWLKQYPTFITLKGNLGNVFSSLPSNSKYIVVVYVLIICYLNNFIIKFSNLIF